ANDVVYYAAAEQRWPNGDALKYGAKGAVAGPSQLNDGRDEERVAVKFADHAEPVAIFIAALQSSEPPKQLPGGWLLGEQVVYLGAEREEHGTRLATGLRGQVVGPGVEKSVAVLFAGASEPILTANVARPNDLQACPALCWELCGSTFKALPEKVRAS
ncbi:unnamed protein product, partial [Durusdinium trenchii]